MENLEFEVYNNRHNSKLTYRVNKTPNGWHVSHISINGDCSRDGKPYFYDNFNQDYIAYPSSFGVRLEWLWEKIDEREIDREEAQTKLQELADWVTLCEKGKPQWKGY